MKLFHLSDLHIGKQLHFYSLLSNQEKILNRIVKAAEMEHPDVILIAGDIYDRSVPPGEAHTVFDRFLMRLSEITPRIPVLIIAGNHDGVERLQYASGFLEQHQIYISVLPPAGEEEFLKKVTLTDEYGPVHFYLLPFTKPSYTKQFFDEGSSINYNDAVEMLIQREQINYDERNVLISHQFYVNGEKLPQTCESEQAYLSVGGIDSVETSIVSGFDYVALGHLHGKQTVGEEKIRYCGSPLKYSLSEEKHQKSIQVIHLGEKILDRTATKEQNSQKEVPGSGACELEFDEIPLLPDQEVRKLRGKLKDILLQGRNEKESSRSDFVSITLTDEEDLFQPREFLEELYPYILEIKLENKRTGALMTAEDTDTKQLNPLDNFRQFYKEIQGADISEKEEDLFIQILEKVKMDMDAES